jgi:hypothetical protein
LDEQTPVPYSFAANQQSMLLFWAHNEVGSTEYLAAYLVALFALEYQGGYM